MPIDPRSHPVNDNVWNDELFAYLRGTSDGRSQASFARRSAAKRMNAAARWAAGSSWPERALRAAAQSDASPSLAYLRDLHRRGLWLAYYAGFQGGLALGVTEQPGGDPVLPEHAEALGASIAHAMVYELPWSKETTREAIFPTCLGLLHTLPDHPDDPRIRLVLQHGLTKTFLSGANLALGEAVAIFLRHSGRSLPKGPKASAKAPAKAPRKRTESGTWLRVVRNGGDPTAPPDLVRGRDARSGLLSLSLPGEGRDATVLVLVGSGPQLGAYLGALGYARASAASRGAGRAAYLASLHVEPAARRARPMLAPWIVRKLLRALAEEGVEVVTTHALPRDPDESEDMGALLRRAGFRVEREPGRRDGDGMPLGVLDLRLEPGVRR